MKAYDTLSEQLISQRFDSSFGHGDGDVVRSVMSPVSCGSVFPVLLFTQSSSKPSKQEQWYRTDLRKSEMSLNSTIFGLETVICFGSVSICLKE